MPVRSSSSVVERRAWRKRDCNHSRSSSQHPCPCDPAPRQTVVRRQRNPPETPRSVAPCTLFVATENSWCRPPAVPMLPPGPLQDAVGAGVVVTVAGAVCHPCTRITVRAVVWPAYARRAQAVKRCAPVTTFRTSSGVPFFADFVTDLVMPPTRVRMKFFVFPPLFRRCAREYPRNQWRRPNRDGRRNIFIRMGPAVRVKRGSQTISGALSALSLSVKRGCSSDTGLPSAGVAADE